MDSELREHSLRRGKEENLSGDRVGGLGLLTEAIRGEFLSLLKGSDGLRAASCRGFKHEDRVFGSQVAQTGGGVNCSLRKQNSPTMGGAWGAGLFGCRVKHSFVTVRLQLGRVWTAREGFIQRKGEKPEATE